MKVLKVEKLNIDGILENINFEIEKGEIVTLVGSSGSGKTSIAKVIMGLSKLKYSGDIFVNSKKDYIRGKDICMIFQDIEQSLNPVLKIKKQFFEALIYHKICDKKNVMEYSKKILHKVNLNEKVLEKLKKDKKAKTIKSNKDAKKILERLAKSEDEDSIIELSFYYSDKDKRVRDINLLAAATSFNSTALHNLGVYYYNKKNEKKSKIYLRAAKEYGYQLETEFENYINKK